MSALVLVACSRPCAASQVLAALGERWRVTTADTPARALAAARSLAPHVVVACAGPGALELARALRADLRTAHVPLLALAVGEGGAPEARAALLQAGADAVLPLGTEPVVLRAWVERTLAARRALRERWSRRAALAPRWEAGDSEAVVFLDRVREAAEAGMALPGFGVGDLAHALALSPRQLTRRLKALAGEAPGALVHRLRMARAAALLAEGHAVGEVAAAVGFRSRGHFREAYRRAFGVLPSESRPAPSADAA